MFEILKMVSETISFVLELPEINTWFGLTCTTWGSDNRNVRVFYGNVDGTIN